MLAAALLTSSFTVGALQSPLLLFDIAIGGCATLAPCECPPARRHPCGCKNLCNRSCLYKPIEQRIFPELLFIQEFPNREDRTLQVNFGLRVRTSQMKQMKEGGKRLVPQLATCRKRRHPAFSRSTQSLNDPPYTSLLSTKTNYGWPISAGVMTFRHMLFAALLLQALVAQITFGRCT